MGVVTLPGAPALPRLACGRVLSDGWMCQAASGGRVLAVSSRCQACSHGQSVVEEALTAQQEGRDLGPSSPEARHFIVERMDTL